MITSSVLDPARYPTFADSRSVADWLRPGAAPFSPYSGTQYMSAGADSTSYKRLGKTLDLTGRDRAEAELQGLGRHRARLGLDDRRGA